MQLSHSQFSLLILCVDTRLQGQRDPETIQQYEQIKDVLLKTLHSFRNHQDTVTLNVSGFDSQLDNLTKERIYHDFRMSSESSFQGSLEIPGFTSQVKQRRKRKQESN